MRFFCGRTCAIITSNMEDITPPYFTKSDKECRLRLENRECCNAQNYLRPHKCNGYCVAKLDGWLRKEYPEMDDETVKEHVIRLTEDNANE